MNLQQPNWPRFLPSRTVIAAATLGPVGQRLPAPGTWGSLAGLVYFVLAFFYSSPIENLIMSALGGYVAVGLCGEAEFRMGKRDPGEVILDEFVAMPLCFLGWSSLISGPLPIWAVLCCGFALFRFFDILKPLGISRLQSLPAGWGIVIDDTAAAIAACATMHGGLALWAVWHGAVAVTS